MNVIAFPASSTFSYLDAGRDGSFVLFSYAGRPVEAIGPFHSAAEAFAWASETGARENVRVDWSGMKGGAR